MDPPPSQKKQKNKKNKRQQQHTTETFVEAKNNEINKEITHIKSPKIQKENKKL